MDVIICEANKYINVWRNYVMNNDKRRRCALTNRRLDKYTEIVG